MCAGDVSWGPFGKQHRLCGMFVSVGFAIGGRALLTSTMQLPFCTTPQPALPVGQGIDKVQTRSRQGLDNVQTRFRLGQPRQGLDQV